MTIKESIKWAVLSCLLTAAAHSQQAFPKRVISMAPNLTEILYDIGAQDLLVGDTDFCKFPPEAQTKAKIGGWINPNYEKIISLKPDLVLTLQSDGKPIETLRHLNIPVMPITCVTIEDVLKAYNLVGKKLGREAQAEKARQKLKKRLLKIQAKASSQKPPTVLFVIDRVPGTLDQIYGAGPRNFIDSMIQWTGGANILADSPSPYPLVSKEELLRRDPDVIINALPPTFEREGQVREETAVWNKLPTLKAVKTHQVYCFGNEDFLVPGPTMVKLAEYLSGIFRKVPKER